MDECIGVIPSSHLARGRLARPWQPNETTARQSGDEYLSKLYGATEEADRKVVDALQSLANERGVPAAQLAIAWQLTKPYVTAPIIGATKPHHLTDAVPATTLKLSPEELGRVAAPYQPH